MTRVKRLLEIARRYAPFGVFHPQKPRHFRAIADTIVENRGKWHKAWRVLEGPCNGCAVQTDGLRDNVLPRSPHFCLTRLGLIEEAIRDDADMAVFADAASVARLGNDRIERLGRITSPLLWRRGERGYRPISLDEAYDLAGEWIKAKRGSRCGFFTTSKAVANEEYYAFQQFARVVGQTNNVDSCARQCHAASVAALKSTLGIGASSGTLSDFMHTDVLVLAGTNLANNQPLVIRYIEHGRAKRGGRPHVIVVNPYREPGLDRYWVPSSPRSALFGSRICDDFVQVRVGGDIAFFNGVVKCLIENHLLTDSHRQFIKTKTTGFEELSTALRRQSFDELTAASGATIEQMRQVATVLSEAENALFCWGMGLTQHRRGTDNVKSVVNVALVLGQLGKPYSGVAPIRGQSGVQASGECGVGPNIFPGGVAIDAESAARLDDNWGAAVPTEHGLATGLMIEAADRGEIELLMSLGGNLRDTMPDRRYVESVLKKTPYRIRLDVTMNAEAMIEPGEASLIIPIRNWYEWDNVFTTTATDRTIRSFRGTLIGQHRSLPESWLAMREIARRVLGDESMGFNYDGTQQIREMMERTIPMYRGIAALSQPHRQMQWGGEFLFKDGFDAMPGRRAVFSVIEPDVPKLSANRLTLTTRRGFGQWNSQHRHGVTKDSLTGATTREAVLIHPDDASRLGVSHGDRIAVTADHGPSIGGVCWVDDRVRPGHVQTFWPLANDLIRRGVYDGPSHEPDYNAVVTVSKA